MDAGGPRRFLDLGVGGVRPRVAQVLAHGGVQQVGLLADHADDLGEVGEPEAAYVDAVDGDPPLGRVEEPGHQRREGRLARPGLADQRHRGAGRDVEVDAVEGRHVVHRDR